MKLRVLSLVDSLGLSGGGERFARLMTIALDRQRFDRTLCVTRWDSEQATRADVAAALDSLREAEVRFIGLERRSRASVGAWTRLWGPLRGDVDVLHGHKFGSNVWVAALGTLARVPVLVAHEQTWSYEGKPLRRLLDRELIARCCDSFVAVSERDRRQMLDVEGVPAEKVVVIPNGIAPTRPSGRDLRAELGLGEGPILGTVCALRPQKALTVLVEAVSIARRRFPSLQVLIVGEGPERPVLERRIRDLGLEGTVTLLGYRADVPDLLASLDAAVLSSDYEGTPLSVMEYMATGLPVVATSVGGVPEIVRDGSEGLLVPRRDPTALAAAIERVIADPALRAEMGRRGRERFALEFDIRVAAHRVERLYEELWRRREAAPPRAAAPAR